MAYKIDTRYLEHDGGTKFYETVRIWETDGAAMLIKRYGPIANKQGGGTVIIERGDYATVLAAEQKILREKLASRKGYQVVPGADFGMHGLATVENRDAIARSVRRSYGGKDASAILSYFGIGGSAPVGEIVDTTAAPEAPAAATTEEWGSW